MKMLLKEADLDCDVQSAGIFAVEDDEAVEEAVDVLTRLYELEGEKHKAQPMTEELAEESDCILTMDMDLKHTLIEAYPDAEEKIYTLLEYVYGEEGLSGVVDIEDPYRGDEEDYNRCARLIEEALRTLVAKLAEA